MPFSSSKSAPLSAPAVGDNLDIFTLCSELHSGAMATLFLARDLLSGEQVVLKIPNPDILNHPTALYHYQNEERISRLLDHPSIVHFIQCQRSRQYIIMEHIVGRDLRSRVGRNRFLDLAEALPLMILLCETVSYLHEHGIVHLDLKPENILCCPDKRIKLIDFGLASCSHLPDLLALDLKKPQGTPWYISPEQLLGERSDLRCDVYSLGMLLYEMVTGCLPWPRSDKVRIARRRLRFDPTPPRYFNPALPPQIQAIILRAINRYREKRYQCAGDMLRDLRSWEQLPITLIGSNCKKPSLLQRLLPGRAVQLNSEPEHQIQAEQNPQIIGALPGSGGYEEIMAEVKKQALIRTADVTLVHVIDSATTDGSESVLLRYGISVQGEQLAAAIERAVQLLRRCSIDPTIRLLRGEPEIVLPELCAELEAELLIIGKSTKKQAAKQLVKRIKTNTRCLIAGEQPFSTDLHPAAIPPDQLTGSQMLGIDIFLIDLWYEHLHYHTESIYQMLLQPEEEPDVSAATCRLGKWLGAISANDYAQWQQVRKLLTPIHEEFHSVIGRVIEADGPAEQQQIYLNESLPLSCELKKQLSQVSRLLRDSLNPEQEPPGLPFLTDDICPVAAPEVSAYGPVLRTFTLNRDLCALSEIQGQEKKQPCA